MRRITHAFRSLAAAMSCATLLVGTAGADEQPGLRADPGSLLWSRVVTRLGVGHASLPLDPRGTLAFGRPQRPSQMASLNLLGDLYFAHSNRFRATGGVLLGSRAMLSPTPEDPASELNDSSGSVPYLGIGFSDASTQGRWGFSADLGVLALAPRPAVRLGRMFSGQQSFDDLVRELRLTPTVQVGVSYSF